MQCNKGIILAGGTGSRLYPLTHVANKQLLPIYDKPVIYYPLTTLMLSGIREILIISSKRDLIVIKNLFGTGEHLGLKLRYEIQEKPRGLPEAFIIGEEFIGGEPVALILGDNVYHGHGLSDDIGNIAKCVVGGKIFVHPVERPERYGILFLDSEGSILDLIEKPKNSNSSLAITGLYFFDGSVAKRAQNLIPSRRGELEITDLIKSYWYDKQLNYQLLGRGYVWFDAGTPESLLQVSNYVEVIQSRQGTIIASPEEVAFRMNFISKSQFSSLVESMPVAYYSNYLKSLLIS